MYLALYKAKGNFIDYLIRKRTKSKYSHVELVLELDSQNNMLCVSSKPGVGVRCDLIHLNKNEWDLYEFDERLFSAKSYVVNFYLITKNASYDYLGVLSFVSKVKEDFKKFFCSEWIACALGFSTFDACHMSPEDLLIAVSKKVKK